MHTIEHSVGQQLRTASRETLSLGVDMDGRGLHWRLAKEVLPQQRLEFALAVYFSHGLYVLVTAKRGFLCVERIAQNFAQLIKARQSGSYLIGHAYAKLLDALGYADHETVAFELIESGDIENPKAFIKGFSDSVAQSLESDVMRIVRGMHGTVERSGGELLVENLRHHIAERCTNVRVERGLAV
ncbi:hypothetical protein [Massilia sp. CCM 8734]|uniref:hypothetical protein n=1 Tax=Massilia sp. CCM 8734 TaxID=2609283 RepID=UPI0014222A73|nr:hypothetical protein [Massilia sp. CCM 8734]NHZ99031.1 hypothetical protein [Massilia sp. CCM 8734]